MYRLWLILAIAISPWKCRRCGRRGCARFHYHNTGILWHCLRCGVQYWEVPVEGHECCHCENWQRGTGGMGYCPTIQARTSYTNTCARFSTTYDTEFENSVPKTERQQCQLLEEALEIGFERF